MLYIAECFASMHFFFILKIINFENFAWILEDLGFPTADSYVFLIGFSIKNFYLH